MLIEKWKFLPNNSNVQLQINDPTEFIKILKLQYENQTEEKYLRLEEKNYHKMEQFKSFQNPLQAEYSPGQMRDLLFPENQHLPQGMILSSLKTKDISESSTNPDLGSCERLTRQSSTGTFYKTHPNLHLLLEYFIEDSDKCIYFPEERLINKIKLYENKFIVINRIEITVKELKEQHNEQKKYAAYLPNDKCNTIVGSIVTEMNDGSIKLIPISPNPNLLEESKSMEDTDLGMTFNHIKSKYDEISKENLNFNKILTTNIHDVVLENLKEIENKRTELFKEKYWPDKLIMEMIGEFKRSITNPYFILTLKRWVPNHWFSESPHLCVAVANFIKNEINKDKFISELLEDYKKQTAIDDLNSKNIDLFEKYYYSNKQRTLDEEKLIGDILLIRGYLESAVVNSINVETEKDYDENKIKKAYVLLVSSNEICSACTNVIPQIKNTVA